MRDFTHAQLRAFRVARAARRLNDEPVAIRAVRLKAVLALAAGLFALLLAELPVRAD